VWEESVACLNGWSFSMNNAVGAGGFESLKCGKTGDISWEHRWNWCLGLLSH